MPERITNPKPKEDEVKLDVTLRPRQLHEFVGQEKIKNNLSILVQAAKLRHESVEHVLLYGPPGLGKTTLAHIIAREMQANIRITSGPAIERPGDLAAILSNLETGDILFIDEIHRLAKTIEEVLYPAMEDYALDIIIGKGPAAKTLRLELPRFTLVGATTQLSRLSAPLRDRFGSVWRFDYYTPEHIGQIVLRAADILGTQIDQTAAQEIARRSRQTPRVANRLLKRVRDYAQVKVQSRITDSLCRDSLRLLEIDHLGLDEVDRQLLTTMISKFQGGPVGIQSLAAATGEETTTIEEVYEPYLMQIGFIQRTPRGRVASPSAYEHLQFEVPSSLQEKLI